jgi:hypothetical protein
MGQSTKTFPWEGRMHFRKSASAQAWQSGAGPAVCAFGANVAFAGVLGARIVFNLTWA